MTTRIFYHKSTGAPVQIVARARTKPTYQEVICYQELTDPYEYYVMEKRQFFAEYVKEFAELPMMGNAAIEKRDDLPDKQPRISKGEIMGNDDGENEEQEGRKEGDGGENGGKMEKLLEFLDADSYKKKIKLLEDMEDELDDHMINNIAVSLDLTIEDGADGYRTILSELRMRDKYESDRGERL